MPDSLPVNSPFKLLQPYGQEDLHLFFGRERETRQLYEALMRSKFMLVYGASGTGKTSLVQCGLQNMYSPRDWLPVLVRRGENFVSSLREELNRRYRERFADYQRQYSDWYPGEAPPEPETFDSLRDLIKALFNLSYVPVYLILDQFEEIFTLGDAQEQEAFFQELEALQLFEEDLFCKLIIITREEYIAHFYRFEPALPFLFEYRYRVEKMRQEQLLQVVERTLTAPYPGYPPFEVEAGTPDQLLNNLTDERGEVDLTTLQVYLDRLYQEDCARATGRDHIRFDRQLVGDNKLANVLSDFLDRQVAQVSGRLPVPVGTGGENLPLQILFQLVTSQGTKQNRSAEEVRRELELGRATAPLSYIEACLTEFAGPDSRILNRLTFANSRVERYEIAHDRLAERVFAKFNADEIRRREARTTIQNKIRRFREADTPREQRQEYLSIGELELVGQSLNTERLEPELRQFFADSRDYHMRRRRRERLFAIGSGLAAIVFLAVAIVAFVFYQRAERAQTREAEARQEADARRQEAEDNLRSFYVARYKEIVTKADNYVGLGSPQYALYEYLRAQTFWRDTLYPGQPDTLQGKIEALRE